MGPEISKYSVSFFSFPPLPDRNSTISELQDQETGEFYVAQERRATDFEAQKL